jgi:hypothetical protein
MSQVSVYIRNRPLESALDMLAMANNLEVEKKGANFYVLSSKYSPPPKMEGRPTISGYDYSSIGPLEVEVLKSGNLNVSASNASIKDILHAVPRKSFRPFLFYDEP